MKYKELLNRGLNEQRLIQMMDAYKDIEAVAEIVDGWGVERCNKGYDIFNYDDTGMLEIEAIIDVGSFDDDEAVKVAEKDGIKIIPVEELPENFKLKFYGWIDTPENRKAIEEYCETV